MHIQEESVSFFVASHQAVADSRVISSSSFPPQAEPAQHPPSPRSALCAAALTLHWTHCHIAGCVLGFVLSVTVTMLIFIMQILSNIKRNKANLNLL